MNTPARLNRLVLCTVAVLVAPIALWSGEALVKIDPIFPVPAGKDPNDPNRFSVSGVVIMTGTPVALVTDTARSDSWFAWGNREIDRYNIREITREQVVLVERGSGRELRLPVAAAAPGSPEPFTKAWINSTANPMLHYIVSPPSELYDDWPTATDADKKEIVDFYEKYGWKLVRAEIVAGAADFVWERFDQAERIAAAEARRAAFADLLSPEQKQLWQQIQLGGSIYAVDGNFTDEQRKLIAERQQFMAKFKATFSPEQQAAYAEMQRSGSPSLTRPEGRKLELILPGLVAPDTAGTAGPARYSRAWINSNANPMLNRMAELPPELTARWPGLTTAERTQVIEYYRKHGWQCLYLETVSGNTSSLSWRNIYEKERIAMRKAYREIFLSLLSPEQRQAWKTGPTGQTIFIKDGNPDYARNRNGPVQQQFFDLFWAALDARQKSAYEDMLDFTRANWN